MVIMKCDEADTDWNHPYDESPSLKYCSEGLFGFVGCDKTGSCPYGAVRQRSI